MVKVIIFEDEPAALRRIKRLIREIRPEYKLVGDADNIADGVALLKQHDCQLILSDIQLSDGLCFEIFEKTRNKIPVIFITAYNEYAIQTFDYNGVHYLVKPLVKEKLHKAINKFEEQKILQLNPEFHTFFKKGEFISNKKILSKLGNSTKVIEANKIAIIYFEDRITRAILFSGKEHYLDYSLNQLMGEFPPGLFYKINRQQIINKEVIKEIRKYPGNRLKVIPSVSYYADLIVSKEKTPDFKNWFQS